MVVGSMGHASSISLGNELQDTNRKVYCIDGDGSLMMQMGILATIGSLGSKNFYHILLNNFSHDSVGGQGSNSEVIDFSGGRIVCLVQVNLLLHFGSYIFDFPCGYIRLPTTNHQRETEWAPEND